MHRTYKTSKSSTFDEPSVIASDYCPIDLYSADEERVSRALEQLWVGWIQDNGQGNSLRLFVDGKIVDPREVSLDAFRRTLSLYPLLSPSIAC